MGLPVFMAHVPRVEAAKFTGGRVHHQIQSLAQFRTCDKEKGAALGRSPLRVHVVTTNISFVVC